MRIWVSACATGEEAYSIAMMLLEIQGSQATNIPVQIFATDLSQKAIDKARLGVYSKEALETISPKRIQRFFTKDKNNFRVNKEVRAMCIFASHNILSDPPFSRLDFISCCNLFIYLDTAAQKKAVNTFHYALNEGGFLMLGKSENISHSTNLFGAVNKNLKLFSRKNNSGSRAALLPHYKQQNSNDTSVPFVKRREAQPKIPIQRNELDQAVDTVLVSQFMPASVVINHQLEILQFRGTTDVFLTHPKGKATFNIIKMARPEIAFELRNTISKVIKSKHRVRKSGIELNVNATFRIISIEVLPLEIEWEEPLLLVLFTEQEQTEIYTQLTEGRKNTSTAIEAAKDRRIIKLEQELAAAHTDALSISHEQETFAEELQSANEEVVSSNEELQTVNEELETSKEEIVSANEELTTSNQELQTRNDLLNEAHDYSEAVFETIHESLLVLDKNLRVKSANKTFYKIFNVSKEETVGALLYELGNKQWNIPQLRELLEKLLPKNTHFHEFEITHTFPIIGEKTMLLNARRIIQKINHDELILLAISDVTEQTLARKRIVESEKRYNQMLMHSPFTFAVLKGKDLIIDLANDRVKEVWGKGKNIEGKSLLKLMPELKDTTFPHILEQVRTSGIPFHGVEVQSPKDAKGQLPEEYFNFVFQPYMEADQTISGITIIGNDVSEQVLAKKKIVESEKKFKQLAELMPQKVWTADANGNKNYFNTTLLDFAGKSSEELIGDKWTEMIHPDDRELDETRWNKSIQSGNTYQSESRFLRKDGNYLWHLTIAAPLKDEQDNVILWIGSKTEIQEQRLQKEMLEQEVTNRTVELSAANEELVRINKELEAFTYVSSHDLQEPLRKIRTIAGRILEKENKNLTDSGKNYFYLIQNAAERMQTLIQDLLTFSRLSMAERNFVSTDLNCIIQEVKKEFKDEIAEKNAVIEVNEICDVKIIPFQFRQLMHNLISNALKFSNPKIPLHIKISSSNVLKSEIDLLSDMQQEEYCHISISDNGIGFEKEFAEKIFDVFQKLHAKDEYAGTGIGLAIVKKIIENHSGVIKATSILNKGTTFDIYIPK